MKIFTATLILHILVLLCQPCEDTFAQDTVRASLPETQSALPPSEDDSEAEDCSPFCICACRQVPSGFQRITPAVVCDEMASVTTEPVFEYTNPYAKNFHRSIWQPPKV